MAWLGLFCGPPLWLRTHGLVSHVSIPLGPYPLSLEVLVVLLRPLLLGRSVPVLQPLLWWWLVHF